MIRQYVDENEEFLLAYSTTTPGLIIVPPGKQPRDAKAATQEEVDKAKAKKLAKMPKRDELTNEDLTKLVRQLQDEVKQLKQK